MSFLGGDCHISHFRCQRHLKTASHKFAQKIPGGIIFAQRIPGSQESRIFHFPPHPAAHPGWMINIVRMAMTMMMMTMTMSMTKYPV